MILYGRIEEALIAAKKVIGNAQFDQKLNNTRNQMQQLKANPPKSISIESFQIPSEEKNIIAIVQILKSIKAILSSESQKGRIPHQVFSSENQKISHFQLRLNIENSVSRAGGMVEQDRLTTAKQMLTKMQLTLESLEKKMPDDKYIQHKLSETKNLLAQIEDKEKAPKPVTQKAGEPKEDAPKPAEGKEDDAIFGDRKKW